MNALEQSQRASIHRRAELNQQSQCASPYTSLRSLPRTCNPFSSLVFTYSHCRDKSISLEYIVCVHTQIPTDLRRTYVRTIAPSFPSFLVLVFLSSLGPPSYGCASRDASCCRAGTCSLDEIETRCIGTRRGHQKGWTTVTYLAT